VKRTIVLAVVMVVSMQTTAVIANNLQWKLGLLVDVFPVSGLNQGQEDYRSLLSVSPSYHKVFGNSEIDFGASLYVSSEGRGQDYFDITELNYMYQHDSWTIEAGIKKVFWGVVESRHLVDVINQQDLRQFPDIDAKLGQPMIHYTLQFDESALGLFALPYFRTRVYPEVHQRFSLPLTVDNEREQYESTKQQQHVDAAVRWAGTWGHLDYGLSYFTGTTRQPTFTVVDQQLQAFYGQKKQYGIDLQATLDRWLLKFEGIDVSSALTDYRAATAGVEYSFYSVLNSRADVGLLLEYNRDDRPLAEADFLQNDVFMAVRVVLNNTQSTELIVGGSVDLDHSANAGLLEFSHRLSNTFSLSAKVWWFDSDNEQDPLYVFRRDDLVRVEFTHHIYP